MIAQGEFRKLLLADTKDRREIFRNIFKTGLYTRFQERVKGDFLALSRKREEARKAFDQYASGIRFPECRELPPENELSAFLAEILAEDRAADGALRDALEKTEKEIDALTTAAAKAEEDRKNRCALNEAGASRAVAEESVKKSRLALETENGRQPERWIKRSRSWKKNSKGTPISARRKQRPLRRKKRRTTQRSAFPRLKQRAGNCRNNFPGSGRNTMR